MEAFVVKILPSLLLIVLMTSSAVAEKLSTDNQNVFILLPQICRRPPVGFDAVNTNFIRYRYICQPNDQQTFYAMLFDQERGLAVFAAYSLEHGEVDFAPQRSKGWSITKGGNPPIRRQGTDQVYEGQGAKYHKGHLVPKRTFSSTQKRSDSTNAVAQIAYFNTHSWKDYENRIREFAFNCIRLKPVGKMYLLTGTSSVHIQKGNPPRSKPAGEKWLRARKKTAMKIAIPSSMWTAGCCVRQNGQYTRSFAVIGNNVPARQELTRQVKVAEIYSRSILGPNVDLFPGDRNCFNNWQLANGRK